VRLLVLFLLLCLALLALTSWLLLEDLPPDASATQTPAPQVSEPALLDRAAPQNSSAGSATLVPLRSATPAGPRRATSAEPGVLQVPPTRAGAAGRALADVRQNGGDGRTDASDAGVRWAGTQAERDAERRLQLARAALADDPRHPDALRDEAAALIQLQRWGEAAESLARLIEICPENNDLRFELATVLMRARRFSAAVAVLQELVARRPDERRAWFNLAVACQAVGRLSAARSAWDRTIALRPTAEAYARRGEVLLDLHEWAAAAADFQAVLAEQPDAVDAALNLATALARLERYGEARASLLAVVQKHPRHVPTLNRLAELAWLTGQVTSTTNADHCRETVEWCRRSLEVDPEQPAIRELLRAAAAGDDR